MKTVTIEKDVEINDVPVHISVDLALVDNGIGSYEFWGQKCCDTRLEWEVQEWDYEADGGGVTSEQVEEWVECNSDTLAEDANTQCEPEPPEPDWPQPREEM